MIKTDEAPMRLRLDERTRAGRLGLQLVAARAALAEARGRGAVEEVERLQDHERDLTARLVREVALPLHWNFGTFGVRQQGGQQHSTGRTA